MARIWLPSRWENRPCSFRYSPTGRPFGITVSAYFLPFSISNSGKIFVSTARREILTESSEGNFQPGGQEDRMWMNRSPFVSLAFRIFRRKSSGKAGLAVAAYGIRWAAMISMMSFFGVSLNTGLGVVVVQLRKGVAELL